METKDKKIALLEKLVDKQQGFVSFLKTKPHKDNPVLPAYDTIINGLWREIASLSEQIANEPTVRDEKHCKTCIHLGIKFPHLNGHNDIDEWYACNCPVPYHVMDRAVPMTENSGRGCRTWKAKETV